MKKILEKKYDVMSATFVCGLYTNIDGYGDMYRNTDGEFFIKHLMFFTGKPSWIEPISIDDAKKLLKERGDFYYSLYF